MCRLNLVLSIFALIMLAAIPAPAQRRGERGADGDKAGGDAAGMAPAAGLGAAANPLMLALDTDGDGTLSAKEIRAAAKALKTLDLNKDGELSPDELGPRGAVGAMGAGAAAGGGIGAPGAAGGGAGRAGGAGFGAAGGRGNAAPGFGAAGAAGGFGGAGGAGGFSRPPGAGLPAGANKIMGFDKNRDGRVTRDELPEQMHALFERLDLNRDGSIDVRELRQAMGRGNAGAGS